MKAEALRSISRRLSGFARMPRARRSSAAAAGFPVPEASAREPLLPRVLLRLMQPSEDWQPAQCPVKRGTARRFRSSPYL